MIANLTHAFRQLRKTPGFTLIALLTLALGIGANVAIFSAINTLFLRPLNFAEPDRLVRLWSSFPDRGLDQANLSYPRYEYLRDQLDGVTDLSAQAFTGFVLTGRGEPQQALANSVSDRFFPLLGVSAQLGRTFRPEENLPGAARVTVLSHGFWQRQFNRDPAAIGQSLTLNGVPHTIIGVLPASFGFPFDQTPLWVARPFELDGFPPDLIQRGSGYLVVTGRLKPGVTLERLNEQMKLVGARYAADHPEKVDTNAPMFARDFHEDLTGNQRPTFIVLLSAVGLVLLIACANIANLFLVRLTSRRKEIAIRTALGATRSGIVRLFLTECVLLSFTAGLLGAGLAYWGVDALARVAGDFIPRAVEISIDGQVLAFALVLSLLTGLALGLVPSWQASHTDINETLKDAGRGSTSASAKGLRGLLYVGEVALSLVLLAGAALLLSSFIRLQQVAPGMRTDGITTFNIPLSPGQYPDLARQTAFYEQLVEKIGALPGVTGVSGTDFLPVVVGGNGTQSPFALEGESLPPVNQRLLAVRPNTFPGYFGVMGIPIKQGRDFTWRDREKTPNVAIISESVAKRLFPNGENPIGRRLITGIASVPREIVGVVGDVRTQGLAAAPRDQMYYPSAQLGDGFFAVVVRSDRPAASLRQELIDAVHAIDPGIPIDRVDDFSALVSASVADRRLVMALVGSFAALALGLAGLGIYGVIAYSVTQRTTEIGVRMAMGATPGTIIRQVLGESLRLTGVGLAIGLIATLSLTRLLQAQLFEVKASDPLILAGVSVFLVAIAALASWLPARRAARIDPLVALRGE